MLSEISKPLTFNQLKSNSEILAELQTLLKEKGFYHLKIDGVWGQGTETAIESVAKLLNLNNFDKKLIGKTFISKLTSYNPEKDTETELDVSPITEADILALSKYLVIELATIKAVIDVESSGSWVQQDGKPIIRFESHIFSSLTNHLYDNDYPNISSKKYNPSLNLSSSEKEYSRLDIAKGLNETAALKSASYGAFQIMGFNHALVGFKNVQDFYRAMFSPKEQLKAFGQFLIKNSLVKTLRIKDWKGFAYSFNGSNYHLHKPPYDVRLENAYQKFKQLDKITPMV